MCGLEIGTYRHWNKYVIYCSNLGHVMEVVAGIRLGLDGSREATKSL